MNVVNKLFNKCVYSMRKFRLVEYKENCKTKITSCISFMNIGTKHNNTMKHYTQLFLIALENDVKVPEDISTIVAFYILL